MQNSEQWPVGKQKMNKTQAFPSQNPNKAPERTGVSTPLYYQTERDKGINKGAACEEEDDRQPDGFWKAS